MREGANSRAIAVRTKVPILLIILYEFVYVFLYIESDQYGSCLKIIEREMVLIL